MACVCFFIHGSDAYYDAGREAVRSVLVHTDFPVFVSCDDKTRLKLNSSRLQVDECSRYSGAHRSWRFLGKFRALEACIRSSDEDLVLFLDADALLLQPLDDRLIRTALNHHPLGMVEQTTITGSTMNRTAFWEHYRQHSLSFIAPDLAPPTPSQFRYFNSGVVFGRKSTIAAITDWALSEIRRSSSDHCIGQHMIADQDYFQVWTNNLFPGICQELPWEWNHCEYWDVGFPRRTARIAHFSNFCNGPAPDTATRMRALLG
ncbi:hypothetical protein [Holophaga foetida]|uniref:hypothetical protein n=1 Tax=Holophaga foetida TaxID=35839 RepID=UPI00024721C2|nr:hypothetical protein [Holophaga foetida]